MNGSKRTGLAELPLHGGRAPRWLFGRMVVLAREIMGHLVAEHGSDEVLRRLADPFWFQAFGCVLGFDWHSSGVTTTTCGALKEAADRLTWPNVLDFLPIDPEYSLVEIAVAESCAGQTLRDADLRKRFGVWVLGVKDALSGKLTIFPDADFRLSEDHILLVVGTQSGLDQLRELQ